ncbi:HlyD family secretion protein [Chelatococcus sp. GCM10030263]|uniref:HlyD family secretion protein n=1 Tax=Chelatococcus sp. GCM10030263 TaxID=3273387 RepID=UPI0036122E04
MLKDKTWNDDEAGQDETPRRGRLRRLVAQRPFLTASIVFGTLVLIAAGAIWWLYARQFETTDDAFIDARTVAISAEVSGAITEVPVTDNQMVEAGAVLARVDPRDYQAALDQAKAQAEQAEAAIANVEAQIGAQEAQIEQAQKQVSEAEAALTFAQDEAKRYTDLLERGSGTEQRAQQATTDLAQRQAALASAKAAATAAERQLAVLRAQGQNARAQLDQAHAAEEQAQANLSRAVVTAPVAGRVTKLSAAKGGHAAPGQALMMLVPREMWVTANFKETQLGRMRPGQPVTISLDAYPEADLKGHIDSIQSGSGTAFSLLPAENATGNYVKVVQRVPVKIVFDEPPSAVIGPGMSVVPSVRIRNRMWP